MSNRSEIEERINIADIRPLLEIGREAYSDVYVFVHGEDDNHYDALDAAIMAVLAAAPARPSRGVVDEDVVIQAERAFWPAYNEALRVHGTKADCHAIGMRAALQAATHPSRGVVDELDADEVRDLWMATDADGITTTEHLCRFAKRIQAATLPAVPEGMRVVGRVQRGPAPHDPLYALILPGVDDSTIPEGTPLYALAAALPAVPADTEWREAFVEVSASRYRDAGMKIEAARIHAEADANQLETIWRAKKAATEGEG